MGAWATSAFGNDTGLDFISKLLNRDAVKKVLSRAGKKPDFDSYDEIRVTATVLIHLHKLNDYWFPKETIDAMADLLDVASKDKEWIDSWHSKKDGEEVCQQVTELAKKLRTLKGY